MQKKKLLSNISKSFNELSKLFDELSNEQEEKTDEAKEKKLALEDVRKILAEKSRLGFTSEIRELLNKYGANKLSEIDEDKYKDLISDANKLN